MAQSSNLSKRSEVEKKFTWAIEDLYTTDEKWQLDYNKAKEMLPKATQYQGRLSKSGDLLLSFLQISDEISILMERIYVYANQKYHEDTANAVYQDLSNKANALSVQVNSALSFATPEILMIPEEDFAGIIKYKLLSEDKVSLAEYMDISEDLADRLGNTSNLNWSLAELAKEIKTKNLTLTRVNRAFIHLLLNIRTVSVKEYCDHGYTPYARLLGIKKESSHLLRNIEKVGRIPIITKVSKAEVQLDFLGMRMFSEDIFAAHLYNQAVFEKYGTVIPNEFKHGVCIL